MDIQLYATDEELKEFPADNSYFDTISDSVGINLSIAHLPRPFTDLPKPPVGLPIHKTKTKRGRKAKRSQQHRTRSNGKNHIDTHSVIQLNECLAPMQEKGTLIQMSATTYLSDQSFSWSLVQPVVHPEVIQPIVGQPVVGQPSGPIPPLLSLQLQPDLQVLTQTLTPQALWYVNIGIQISRSLSKE